MKVQFGVHLPIHGPYDYKVFLDMVMFIDRLGFDYFTVGDHFFLPSDLYVKVGGDPSKPNKMDAWTVLAAAAAKTENVRLGTRVSPIPFYIPSRLAKIVATADIISNGRVIFGVGAGWYSEEAIAYGVGWGSHRERIERMLEGLEIILDLWSKERATYEGKYYRVLDAPCWPKPLQKPHPPIWFGGSSRAIIRAAVKYGDGVFPITDTQMSELLRIQRNLREEAILRMVQYFGSISEKELVKTLYLLKEKGVDLGYLFINIGGKPVSTQVFDDIENLLSRGLLERDPQSGELKLTVFGLKALSQRKPTKKVRNIMKAVEDLAKHASQQ